MFNRNRIIRICAFVFFAIATLSAFIVAQTPAPTGPVMRFTATTANVSGAPDPVRIDVLAWSTDADRDQMLAAWNMTAPPPAAAGAAGRGGAGGRGARGGGRGAETPDAGAAAANPPDAAAGAAAGGAAAAGAGGGRGGRGGGRGGAAPAADTAKQTPEGSLAAALQTAKTVGYVWTSESAGYSIRYAYRVPQPDGSERIIFATERRLGAWNDLWKPAGGAPVSSYDFSVIELHLNAKGEGEGKTSLTGKVVVDSSAKTIALDGYNSLPVVFKDVKRRSSN
jgi:hypothetical protein